MIAIQKEACAVNSAFIHIGIYCSLFKLPWAAAHQVLDSCKALLTSGGGEGVGQMLLYVLTFSMWPLLVASLFGNVAIGQLFRLSRSSFIHFVLQVQL